MRNAGHFVGAARAKFIGGLRPPRMSLTTVLLALRAHRDHAQNSCCLLDLRINPQAGCGTQDD